MGREIAINALLQVELRRRDLGAVDAVTAARWLEGAGLLKDSGTRPGKPLRDLLRAGVIAGQRQEMNGRWFVDRVGPPAAPAASPHATDATPETTEASAPHPTQGRDGEAVQRFASARAKYMPERVRCVLVAEAPPKADSGRFFYFEDVTEGDSVFWETMKALYPGRVPEGGPPRRRKAEFLARFRADGFHLLDAVDEPLGKVLAAVKRRRIRESLPRLRDDLRRVCDARTKVILISAPVYAVCAAPLRADGFHVVNEEMIDFPGSGRQREFHEKFARALRSTGWRPTL